jgi:polysaccharide biosynthesis protein PslH
LPGLDPAYTLTVIGMTPNNVLEKYKDDTRIIFREGVDDLSTELLSYDIALAPLREGSGTRLKLLDYLASGLPVISSVIGAEGLSTEIHSHITVEDDVRRYAQRIRDIAEDLQAFADRSQAGRAFIEREYDWTACIEPFLKGYRQLIEKGQK